MAVGDMFVVGKGGGADEVAHGNSSKFKIVHPRDASSVGVDVAPRDRRPLPPPSAGATVGSVLDLDDFEQGDGTRSPRTYCCRDGSLVVLGTETIVSARPDTAEPSAPGLGGRQGGAARTPGRAVVSWALSYEELESCCVNVSAGKGGERSVGDVVVEITSR